MRRQAFHEQFANNNLWLRPSPSKPAGIPFYSMNNFDAHIDGYDRVVTQTVSRSESPLSFLFVEFKKESLLDLYAELGEVIAPEHRIKIQATIAELQSLNRAWKTGIQNFSIFPRGMPGSAEKPVAWTCGIAKSYCNSWTSFRWAIRGATFLDSESFKKFCMPLIEAPATCEDRN